MDSFRFSATCRALALAARELGLDAPSFRSPPGVADATRTLRRRGAGPAVVAVAIHERPAAAVIADLIEGVVVANRLAPKDAVRARSALWEAVSGPGAVNAA
jgi:hypothetical protein